MDTYALFKIGSHCSKKYTYSPSIGDCDATCPHGGFSKNIYTCTDDIDKIKELKKKGEHSKKSSPRGPLCAIFPRGVASFPIWTPKRDVRPLWPKLAKGQLSLEQVVSCFERVRRMKEKAG